jgi:2-polyprenyl-3-methyl-5-hydroxy-6-metoxy-1,4-benzoquinol methylase
MENISGCQICNGSSFVLLAQPVDYLVSGEMFGVVKCNDCGFVFTNPRPELNSLFKYYKSADYISHTDSDRTLTERVYKYVKHFMLGKKVRLLHKLKPGLKSLSILDYGCATGEFVLRAQQGGFETFGFEPDQDARERAINKGVRIFDAEEVQFNAKEHKHRTFDIITLWHVLEHIPDLNTKAKLLNQLLNKDGLIVVAVPEFMSYDSSFYKDSWAAWDVPRHLNHFEEKTIVRYFEKHGFYLVNIQPLYFDSFYIALLSEKILKNGLAGMARAFIIGLFSNIKALLSKKPFSSQIYIFKKHT